MTGETAQTNNERIVAAVKSGHLKPWVFMLCPDGKGGRRFECLTDVPLAWGCPCGFTHGYNSSDAEILFDAVETAQTQTLRALIQKWRDAAVWEHDDMCNVQSAQTFDQCADELEAALASPPSREGQEAQRLAPWLRHHSVCDRNVDAGDCNCGLNDALRELKGPSEETKD